MKEELERYKAALDMVLNHLDTLGHEHDAVFKKVRDILNPPPVYETVEEIVGWVNVYQNAEGKLRVGGTYNTEDEADSYSSPEYKETRLSCQPIKVTVQREKKMPVERSVTVEGGLTESGNLLCAGVFKSAKSFHGKHGTLTFTVTE